MGRRLRCRAKIDLEGVTREFALVVKSADAPKKELTLRLEVRTPKEGSREVDTDDAEFRVDFFDFPMIDHARLSRDQRCAVVIRNFGKSSARVALVYFPGSYASLKEKPYIQEMIRELLGTRENAGAGRR